MKVPDVMIHEVATIDPWASLVVSRRSVKGPMQRAAAKCRAKRQLKQTS